jgi:hypothetical protein
MSSEVAQVSMSQRSSHSTIGVEVGDLSSSDREFAGVISGEVKGRLAVDTSYSILKEVRS